MACAPRVAFFTNTYWEINGLALTSRHLTSFAEPRGYPFLCVRGAPTSQVIEKGNTTHVEVARGPGAFNVVKDLWHDPFLWRHIRGISSVFRQFRPDMIHIVSPGDESGIGVYVAKRLCVPVAISSHTNLRGFAAMRLGKLTVGNWPVLSRLTENRVLQAMAAFYRLGSVLLAPNEELVQMLQECTKKPVYLMKRGIDVILFDLARRTVTVNDGVLRLGFVGRITPEKNVCFLRDLELDYASQTFLRSDSGRWAMVMSGPCSRQISLTPTSPEYCADINSPKRPQTWMFLCSSPGPTLLET